MLKRREIFIGSILFGLILFIVWSQYTTPKYAYVDIKEVYDGLELKKELEKNYTQVVESRQKILDSLSFQIKLYESKFQEKGEKLKDEMYNIMIADYYEKKKNFTEDNNTLAQKMDEKILGQINQYIKEYGEANHYTFIFGASGNGSIMFAKESKNITKSFIVYVNNQNKGDKK
jgi:outer membrane protein